MPAKTIADAIIEVLKKARKPLSIKEITQHIEEEKSYTFHTDHPEHVVRNQLRRHCDNLELKGVSKEKHFTLHADGTYGLKK